jgi:hypothetical protein
MLPLSSSPSDAGVWTKSPPSHALHGARCHCTLRRVSARSLCHCVDPSPPSLSPWIGPCCFHTMRSYKRSPLSCLLFTLSASCPPLVSRHHRARLCFLPHHRCRATSPLLSPRGQVQELRQTSELLPDLKDRHLHRR